MKNFHDVMKEGNLQQCFDAAKQGLPYSKLNDVLSFIWPVFGAATANRRDPGRHTPGVMLCLL